MPNGSLQPGASDEPGGQTQGSIEIAAERNGVCIATLRRTKFDIGIRSSKDGKSGARWWTLPRRMSTLRGNEARCSNNYLSTLSIFMKQTTYLATLPNRVPWSVDGAPIHGAAYDGDARTKRTDGTTTSTNWRCKVGSLLSVCLGGYFRPSP